MTRLATAALCAGLTALPAAAQDATPFAQGLADRTALQAWVETLNPEAHRGAFYWTGQRSLAKPGSCYGAGGQPLGEFTAGCVAAQSRLAPLDIRRRTEPDYRAGWNSWQPPDPASTQRATTPGDCKAITDSLARLTCYDRLASAAPAQPASPERFIAVPATALPPPDLAASQWLNDIAPRLYAENRAVHLVRDCLDNGQSENVVRYVVREKAAIGSLLPADQDYAWRIANAGGEDGLAALKRDKNAACLTLTAALTAKIRAVTAGSAGFWDGLNQLETPDQTAMRPAQIASPVTTRTVQRGPQAAFVDEIDRARQAFDAAPNDLVAGAIRPERARRLCALLPDSVAADWHGQVETLSSTNSGYGVLGVRISPHVTLQTSNLELFDGSKGTLLRPGSEIMQAASRLSVGSAVTFSGRFFPALADCMEEVSVTQRGSMEEPEFRFRFTALRQGE